MLMVAPPPSLLPMVGLFVFETLDNMVYMERERESAKERERERERAIYIYIYVYVGRHHLVAGGAALAYGRCVCFRDDRRDGMHTYCLCLSVCVYV